MSCVSIYLHMYIFILLGRLLRLVCFEQKLVVVNIYEASWPIGRVMLALHRHCIIGDKCNATKQKHGYQHPALRKCTRITSRNIIFFLSKSSMKRSSGVDNKSSILSWVWKPLRVSVESPRINFILSQKATLIFVWEPHRDKINVRFWRKNYLAGVW